jgi:endonuclease YncB( thermonuclease family)
MIRHAMKRVPLIHTLVLTALVFAFGQTYGYGDTVWQGKVVGVSDGDTITVMHDGKGERIRLYGIDCPEKRQAFGKRAKQFASSMVFGKNVEVRSVTTDRYGRTIAWVYVNGTSLNEELLEAGFAWHYKRYSTERHLAELEDESRAAKAGLWSDPQAIPPWDFRRGKTSVTSARSEPAVQRETRTDRRSVVYHGNVKSKKFHRPSCRYYDCTNCTAVFHSREEAIQAGYVPCKVCKP